MNITFSPSPYARLTPPHCQLTFQSHLLPLYDRLYHRYTGRSPRSSLSSQHYLASLKHVCKFHLSVRTMNPSNEGTISVMNFEDFVEKDWSFLEFDTRNSEEEHKQKIDQIISAGIIGEASRILISTGSEEFVDRVVASSPYDLLLIIHDSLLTLACIKEKYDKVKCWQGELIYVPEKWAPFDTVFLYFLPALPFKLAEVLETLAKRCLPGARVVISHLQGRQELEQQRKQYPDIVVSNLPDKATLIDVAANYSFKVVEFVDEPDFYLAALSLEEKSAE